MVKSLYVMIGVSLLMLIFGAVMALRIIWQVDSITQECDVLIQAALDENLEEAQAASEVVAEMINKHSKVWHLLVNHNDLILIDAVLADVQMAIQQEDMAELQVLSTELRRALLIMSDKEKPTLHNIL